MSDARVGEQSAAVDVGLVGRDECPGDGARLVRDPLRIGQNIREVLEADLAGEHDARTHYGEAREVCRVAGDIVSMKLFEELLADEEGHIDFFETQISLHDELGAEQYGLLQAGSADEAD